MRKRNLFRSIILITAIALIASFVLHDVIPHEHPSEIYGTGIQAIFHGSDRKYWYLLLLAFVWIAVDSIAKREFDIRLQKSFAYIRSLFHIDVGKLFNPILQALRTGILNPKLCD